MPIKEISDKELDGLLKRLEEAISNDLSLTKEDMKLLLEILVSFAHLSEQLSDNDITLHKLKKLAGIVSSSEKFKSAEGEKNPNNQKEKKLESPEEKGKKVVEHVVCNHKLEGLAKGDICPKCGKGKLYKYEPAITVRISGNSPLVSTKHIRERLRCNSCLEYFTADLPQEVKDDGGENNHYTYSAKTIMAIYRYFGGIPLYRQGSLNNILGVPVKASTILDQVEHVANAGNSVFNYLKKLASDAILYNLDDTKNKILEADKEMIPDRRTGKLKERSGVNTSGIIAKTGNYKIVLFKTSIGHAGEFIDEILKGRDAHAPPPLIMSDALSSNKPTVISDYHLTLCNAHARREFFDLQNYFPDKVNWVLEKYRKIWENDKKCIGKSQEERLAYHKEHSLPAMLEIKSWGEKQLQSSEVEENSSLGKAIKYFLKHFVGLSAFCNVEGAKIDNNEMESTLKLIIRGRKNSLFFKTQPGADIADVLTSLIATCQKQGVNPFDYLTELQKHSDKTTKNPENWLPWNYKDTLKNLKIENEKSIS
jgi:transposase